MYYDIYDSPVGNIIIATDGKNLTEVRIKGDRYFKKIPSDWIHNAKQPIIIQAKKQLAEYFSGKRKKFDIPFLLLGTEFQKKVWHALEGVPLGKTISYKQLAKKVGNPNAIRAVGTALGRNRICIIIPCHRILSSDGSLGGYAAGLTAKKKLLDLEK